MKIIVESTDKIVDLIQDGVAIACRVWEGQTESGVKVHCFIPRIAAKDDQDLSQFERELQEKRRASPEICAIPLRLIL
jgi:hypothetical protein